MKGIEIAKKLNISTSALKHYEEWGLIPPVEREKNGYRKYKKEHEEYFKCIIALNRGFGMDVVREVMPLVQEGEYIQVFWMMNKAQVELREKRVATQNVVEVLDEENAIELDNRSETPQTFSIGELVQKTNIPASTIRHWEKEGLLKPSRHKESGFRRYTPSDFRQVLVISTLQKAVYYIEIVREVLSGYDLHNITHSKMIVEYAIKCIDDVLVEQMRGIAVLHHLIEMLQDHHTTETR